MSDDFTIRLAEEHDLTYVMALQRQNRESVGGLPKPAIAERVQRRTLALGLLNGEPCGYLLYDVQGPVLRIPQACIQYDARRRKYGEELVRWLLAVHPVDEIRLRCAADIEANIFWRDMGFKCTAVVDGGARRGRLINCWTLWLTPRLIGLDEISTVPAAQMRVDSMYDDTQFIRGEVEGFRAVAELPKLAWADRRRLKK